MNENKKIIINEKNKNEGQKYEGKDDEKRKKMMKIKK